MHSDWACLSVVSDELFRLLACGRRDKLSVFQSDSFVVDMFGLLACGQRAFILCVCNMTPRGQPNGRRWRRCRNPMSCQK